MRGAGHQDPPRKTRRTIDEDPERNEDRKADPHRQDGGRISQLELADALDVHVSTIRRLENDWRAPTSIEVAAIARVIQMETAWIERLLAHAPHARSNGSIDEPELSTNGGGTR